MFLRKAASGAEDPEKEGMDNDRHPYFAHETVRKCPGCGAIFGADTLRQVVPVRSNVAYDVLVFVGRSMYERYKTTEEIHAQLAVRNGALVFFGNRLPGA